MKRRFLLLFVIFCGLGFTAQPVSAIASSDVAIMFSPTSQTISMNAGQVQTAKVAFTNVGEVAFDITVSAAPFQVNSETYDHDFQTEGVYTQMYTWIKLPQTEFHLEPKEEVTIQFAIDVPEGAAAGGQYAAILATVKDVYSEDEVVQVTPQVAALLYGRINGPDMEPRGEVVEQTIPEFIFGGPLDISETVYNTGNVDFQVYHNVKVEDYFSGQVLFDESSKDANGNEVGIQTGILFPGTSRKQAITWDNTPKIGVVRVKQTVMFLEEEATYEQVVIICPLWLILSVTGLIILAILWIILAARRRKRKAPQVF